MGCEQCAIGHCIMCDEKWDTEDFHLAACVIHGMIRVHTYEPGETIFRKNESSRHLYILKSGRVKLTAVIPGGRNQIVGLVTHGHLLGVDTLSDEVYTYSATATSTVTACKFKHKAMLRAIKEHPALTINLLEDLNAKLAQTRALIEAMGHRTAAEKIAACILALQPHNVFPEENSSLKVSRLDIANMLGLTEETVCRVMARLRRMEVIEAPRGNIFIRNRERLQNIADEAVVF